MPNYVVRHHRAGAGVQLGFGGWRFQSWARTDVTMFVWPIENLNRMATEVTHSDHRSRGDSDSDIHSDSDSDSDNDHEMIILAYHDALQRRIVNAVYKIPDQIPPIGVENKNRLLSSFGNQQCYDQLRFRREEIVTMLEGFNLPPYVTFGKGGCVRGETAFLSTACYQSRDQCRWG